MPTYQVARQEAFDNPSQFDSNSAGAYHAAVNANSRVMVVWRATIGLAPSLPYARIQDRDGTVVSATTQISSLSSINSLRVCSTILNNGFVVLIFVSSGLYYRRFQSDGTDRDGADINIAISDLQLNAGKVDFGCDDLGRFTVLYSRTGGSAGTYIQRFNDDGTTSLSETLVTTNSTAVQKLLVHPASGRITVIERTGTVFSAHRLSNTGSLLSTVTIHSGMTFGEGFGSGPTCALQRYGDDGFIAFWVDTSNVVSGGRFRAFDGDGNALYATQTLTTTDPTTSITASYGYKPFTSTSNFRIIATNGGSDPERYHILDTENPPNQSTDAFIPPAGPFGRAAHTALLGFNRTEWHHLYGNFSALQRIGYEVFQAQSCRMSLWRIERNTRVFRNTSLDPDATLDVEGLYSNESKLAGSASSTDSAYQTARSVNPDTAASWSAFLGSADEDTVFIGGPESSEIAASMELNSAAFDAQITALSSELGISAIQFLYGGSRTAGYGAEGVGAAAPAIQLTNTNGTYTLERHTSGANVVDYALMIRLPVSASSTQSTKCFWYIAGINGAGTEAAAYVMENFDAYDTGESNALLLKLVYPSNIRSANEYFPGSTGTIDVYAMSSVNANNYEG